MSEVKFKAGDKVYYPTVTNAIVKLERSVPLEDYPLLGEWYSCGNVTKCVSRFLSDGRLSFFHRHSSIFPATQEWYDKLVHIYPDLEAPPKQKEPIDVVIAMLEGGHKEVCLKAPMIGHEIVGNPTHARNACHAVKKFKPYCLKKGKYIVDFIDGKCVLENGEVV